MSNWKLATSVVFYQLAQSPAGKLPIYFYFILKYNYLVDNSCQVVPKFQTYDWLVNSDKQSSWLFSKVLTNFPLSSIQCYIVLTLLVVEFGALDFQFRDYFHLVARCVVQACAWRSYTMSSAHIIQPKLQCGVGDTQAAWQYVLLYASLYMHLQSFSFDYHNVLEVGHTLIT